MNLHIAAKWLRRLTIVGIVFAMNSAFAGPYSDALGKKLVASTTTAEKAICVRWMFVSMALHPDLKDMASVTAEQREEANRAFAKLVTRMLTETCATEAREAMKYEGNSAIESAFNIFGQVAGRELFTNPSVSQGLADLTKYVDAKALAKALTDAPSPTEEK